MDIRVEFQNDMKLKLYKARALLELVMRNKIGTITLEETPLKWLDNGELFIYKGTMRYLLMRNNGRFAEGKIMATQIWSSLTGEEHKGEQYSIWDDLLVVDTGVRL